VLPTLLEAVGAADATPDDLDGRSQWAALNGDGSGSETPDYVTTGFDGPALYRAPWKLHEGDPPRLYDIFADPYEEKDLASDHPEIVAEMTATLDAWPRGTPMTHKLWHTLFDPDSFGGPEDRAPWADVAWENAAENAQ
jgi:arylsulfatase A-like enzyme